MNLEGDAAPEFQNGASAAEIKKLRAFSDAQGPQVNKSVEVVGGTGDPVYEGGTMQVKD